MAKTCLSGPASREVRHHTRETSNRKAKIQAYYNIDVIGPSVNPEPPRIILTVAVPVPLRRSFEYLMPGTGTAFSQLNGGQQAMDLQTESISTPEKIGAASQQIAPQPGTRVRVPFGSRQLIGIVLKTAATSEFELDKLKPASLILDEKPIIDETMMQICLWAADYYQHAIGEVLHTAIPVLLRKGEADTQAIDYLLEQPQKLMPDLRRSPKQTALLSRLRHQPEGFTRGELIEQGISRSVMKALVDKKLAYWLEKDKHIEHFDSVNILAEDKLALNDEQSAALANSAKPGVNLIFGITGSGKTEVYLQRIEATIAEGKQALVLVPEIGLTPQTVRRFRKRFKTRVVVLHSALTDRERLYAFRQAKLGGAGIIIGTRSAIFTPLKFPGVIVVDEEHDASFKQQEGFRYSARDLAVYRGHIENIPVILGTATPALESYHNAISGKYRLSRLTKRPTKAGTAQFKLIGVQNMPLEEGFSKPLIDLIRQHLNDGNQVLVFLNRRGFSPVILCHVCGWIAECPRCDARLTYHKSTASLVCHHCAYQSRLQRHCLKCQSDQLVPLGAGTQRIEFALKQQFPDQEIIRIDRDSTRNKGAMEDIMDTVNQGKPALLVGTQLLAKGHHFPDVTLVAIMDMDSGFYSSDYRAIERMGQLLLQVAGRAGRENKPGTVAIQTHFPEQPILQTLIKTGYGAFADQLLAERKAMEFPPYAYQVVIRAEATSKPAAMSFLTKLSESVGISPSVDLLGPVAAPMERRAGKHRAQLLVTCKNRATLQANVKNCIEFAEQSPLARKLRWSVDVDPIDLF